MATTTKATIGKRQELVSNIFASFALERMYPSDDDIKMGQDFVSGKLTAKQIVEQVKKKYRVNA